jgi:murein DD-endopeptidase MepM/ murein hydrolase activator NlpD
VRSNGRVLRGLDISDQFYVKIVRPQGERVHRFHVARRQIEMAAAAACILVLATMGIVGAQFARAHARRVRLQEQAKAQQAALQHIDRETAVLRKQLDRVQKENQEIRRLIGAPASPHPLKAAGKTSWVKGSSLRDVAANVQRLRAASEAIQHESDATRTLAMRVLNIRRMRELTRAKLLAEIPSIDPVAGAEIVGCFCYRTYPDVEFHEGVDLGADYGATVRAAAAGTVISAGWDGGYGIKIDIDHGNGYDTWYAHLSRVDVSVGEHVYKGQTIGAVGATGFATGPHLHYQVMYHGTPVNPTPYLDGVPSNVLAKLP